MNFLMFKLVLEKAVELEIKEISAWRRDQIANIRWIMEKAREFQKNIYFCFIDYAKAFDLWITINCGKLREMGIPDHLTCLLRNLYAGQEATVRTGLGRADWFQIGKGVHQGCILSLCSFKFYAAKDGEALYSQQKQDQEYVKAVYCHPAYLTYMQSTS